MDKYILDENGNPVPEPDILKWGFFFEDYDKRIVKHTEIGDILVSTVFLGMDHNWGGNGPPILWESMVFGGKLNYHQRRYASREAALTGHEELIQTVFDSEAQIQPENADE